MPTNSVAQPTASGASPSSSSATGVPPSSAGSKASTVKLAVGCRKRTRAGTSTLAANVSCTSQHATGTVLRSTTASPRAASTTSAQPMKDAECTPSASSGTWHSQSASARHARCAAGPAPASSGNEPVAGAGGCAGAGGGTARACHTPPTASRVHTVMACQRRSHVSTATRSRWLSPSSV